MSTIGGPSNNEMQLTGRVLGGACALAHAGHYLAART
jgi:hypothetical protein